METFTALLGCWDQFLKESQEVFDQDKVGGNNQYLFDNKPIFPPFQYNRHSTYKLLFGIRFQHTLKKVKTVQSHYWRQCFLTPIFCGQVQISCLTWETRRCANIRFSQSALKLFHVLVMYSDCPFADINVSFSLFKMLRSFHSSQR